MRHVLSLTVTGNHGSRRQLRAPQGDRTEELLRLV